MSITLELPYPVSANRYWRKTGNRTYISAEAQQYRKAVALKMALGAYRRPYTAFVELGIYLHPKKPKQRRVGVPTRSMDLDNALKVLIDALQGYVYEDDSQIRRIVAERMEPVPGGKVVVTAREIA